MIITAPNEFVAEVHDQRRHGIAQARRERPIATALWRENS
jgi:hypothetical protein